MGIIKDRLAELVNLQGNLIYDFAHSAVFPPNAEATEGDGRAKLQQETTLRLGCCRLVQHSKGSELPLHHRSATAVGNTTTCRRNLKCIG